MRRTLFIDAPPDFDFRQTVLSHGWGGLPPFEFDSESGILTTVLTHDKAFSVKIGGGGRQLAVRLRADFLTPENAPKIIRDVRHIFRFDDDLREFYRHAKTENTLAWIADRKAGRLLRSPTVFEDLVKTICTTNCSWALTKIMVRNLVEKLGAATAEGRKAFPTAEAMAAQSEDFYREEIRAGYRASYFVELAQKITNDKLNVENWLSSELSTAELKKEIKKIKGAGDYAAENLLKLLGRSDGLALDSMLRGRFYKKHNGGTVCEDARIETHYERFGIWRGLAIWCDLTGE